MIWIGVSGDLWRDNKVGDKVIKLVTNGVSH